MLKSSKSLGIIISIILMLVLGVLLYFFNSTKEVEFNTQSKDSNVKYEKAKVLQIESEQLKESSSMKNMYLGSQNIKIQITTGNHKGDIKAITNYLTDIHNIYVKPGMSIIVDIESVNANDYGVTVYNYYRAPIQIGFVVVFFIALWIIGGKKGFKSIISLIITFVSVIYLFIPMLYKGYSPMLACFIIVIFTTSITLLLLNGLTAKTVSAIVSTFIGVIIAGLLATLVGSLAHLTGFNTSEAETLSMISTKSNMQVQWLLLAAILIASLGAVMDLSISIASAVQEIYETNKMVSKKELFISGMNVGKDMMGTMANTLILAFAGTSLNMLIIIYSYNVSFTQLINMDMVNVEIIQGLTGSFSVILIVPIIAFISSRLIPSWKKSFIKENNKCLN